METDKCCLYCNEPLNMSNEHILQEGFGATLSSTEILCRNCNDLFSSTIDIICVEQNALLCNQAGISGKLKKRRKKEGGKKVIVYNCTNRKFEIDGKQKIKELKKAQVNEITDENGKLTGLSINGYDSTFGIQPDEGKKTITY